ncbi:urease subunit beta [Lipingzhangella sp. LS1_29]|uniref:Urease subunit beta n=1 Tax=Lipingzhangella rawalii TaxID=2055835 RepID=A0ABU2H2A2_9ACTN|nr:urease subunit beta [Lipingzhangella rawalii]MDS1269426.1 urease subunit beta [Lipingzhangella rawalii]
MIPGEICAAAGELELNAGRPRRLLVVANDGDRPIQIGSHFHLAEANPALRMDRAAAWGQRLDLPAGGSLRILPGTEVEVAVVPFAGARRVPGIRTGKSHEQTNTAAEAQQ